MTEPSWALQQALYSKLSAALSCPVHDKPKQGAAFPYVTFARTVARNMSYLNAPADLRFVYLSIWSRHGGQKEVLEIISEIYAALNEQPLEIATGHVVSVRVEDWDAHIDADGETYQGQVTLRIITTH